MPNEDHGAASGSSEAEPEKAAQRDPWLDRQDQAQRILRKILETQEATLAAAKASTIHAPEDAITHGVRRVVGVVVDVFMVFRAEVARRDKIAADEKAKAKEVADLAKYQALMAMLPP